MSRLDVKWRVKSEGNRCFKERLVYIPEWLFLVIVIVLGEKIARSEIGETAAGTGPRSGVLMCQCVWSRRTKIDLQ